MTQQFFNERFYECGSQSASSTKITETLARFGRQPLFKTQLFIAAEGADLTCIGDQLVRQGLKDFVVNVCHLTHGAVTEAEALRAAMVLENPYIAALVETCKKSAKEVVWQHDVAARPIFLVGYNPFLGNLRKLEQAANMFKTYPSAISKDGPLRKFLEYGKIGLEANFGGANMFS